MKTFFTILLFTLPILSFASDGEYRCSTVENVNFQDLSRRALSVSYQIDKVKELKQNGLRSAALRLIKEGHSEAEQTRLKYKDQEFCYSLSKRAEYQVSLLQQYKQTLQELSEELSKHTDCSYAIYKLEQEVETIDSNSVFYEKFLATSNSITKATLIRKDRSCNPAQQEQINQIISVQTNGLSSLYQNLSKS